MVTVRLEKKNIIVVETERTCTEYLEVQVDRRLVARDAKISARLNLNLEIEGSDGTFILLLN